MRFIPLILYIIAWICAFFNQHFVPGDFITYLLMYVFLFSVGISYLWSFVGFTFCPEKIAECYGRKTSEFQYDIGIASLGFGVLGILCFAYQNLWLATGIVVAIFGLGHAYGYLLSLIRNKEASKSNAGIVPFISLVVSITLIVGLWIQLH